MPISVRRANSDDAAGMCAVLNPIIETGGTTAHRDLFDAAEMRDHYISRDATLSSVVALRTGVIVGFQHLAIPDPAHKDTAVLPDKCLIIATFVAEGQQGQGIGHKLFAESVAAAQAAGYAAIDATIRHENKIGQRFYESLGFHDYRAGATAVSKLFIVD